jgi:hypothetical protein
LKWKRGGVGGGHKVERVREEEKQTKNNENNETINLPITNMYEKEYGYDVMVITLH